MFIFCKKNKIKKLLLFLSLIFSIEVYSQPTKENLIVSIDSLSINNKNMKIDKVILSYKSKKELRKIGLQNLYTYNESTIAYKYWFAEKKGVINMITIKFYIKIGDEKYWRVLKHLPLYSSNPKKNKKIISEKKSYLSPTELMSIPGTLMKVQNKLAEKTSIVTAKLIMDYNW